jgi:FMN reductase
MRPLLTYLHADPVSTSVFAAAEDWAGEGEGATSLRSRIDRAAGELADAVARRAPASVADPFDPASYLGEGRSFESLLGGLAAD